MNNLPTVTKHFYKRYFKVISTLLSACVLLNFPQLAFSESDSKTLSSSPSIKTIALTIPTDVYSDYLLMIEDQNPILINDFTHPKSRRDVVELIYLQQALHLGGLENYKLEFVQVDSYLRAIRMLDAGKVALIGTSLWSQDIEKNEFLQGSQPVVEKHEFIAGLYTKKENFPDLFSTAFEITKTSVVSSRQWTVDWQTLNSMPFEQIIDANSWNSMVQMVNAGRAQILLAPFQPNENMLLKVGDIELTPVPNIKIGLNDSRQFVVSKAHVHYKEVNEALNKGLDELKKKGIIKKAYNQSGFMNPKVEDWPLLNLMAPDTREELNN